MSKDSSRAINDYYATVHLRRHHAGKPPESGEGIEVVVRIPEQEAKFLTGPGRKPEVIVCKVYRRVRNVATETVGVPNVPWAITVISMVDSSMPHGLPSKIKLEPRVGIMYSQLSEAT